MGLFGKLFEKKECAFCGGEIGLFGNRKLEDGSMCKECAGKLSPWFDERRHSTVEQIREQLEYREANKDRVASFHATRALGEHTKVLIDEDAGRFTVTSARCLADANPDVLDISAITGCVFDIDEDVDELTRLDDEGEPTPYDPPRFRHSYDFFVTVYVSNPYFDDMRFKLNSRSVEIEEAKGAAGRDDAFGALIGAIASANAGRFDPESNADYRTYRQMGEEIKAALLDIRQTARDAAVAAAQPKAAVLCPSCGATTTPTQAGCCEFCGAALGA